MTSLKSLKLWSEKKIHKPNDLLQVASDDPNIHLLFLKLNEEKRCLNELPALLDIGMCGIHTIHGSLKNAEKASKWGIGKVLWTLLQEKKSLKKSLSLMFIHCHIVVIDGARMKICTVLLKYGQHSIH